MDRLRSYLPVLLIAAALIPSAWLAWRWQEMPQLGLLHDDSINWVTARSLAAGHGYRIESLPSSPLQTKYPPLMPALLSVVWRIAPEFPANLPLATMLLWLMLPCYLFTAWRLFGEYGFGRGERTGLCAALAANPVLVMYGLFPMAELLFGTLLMASIYWAEKAAREDAPPRWAAVAGVLGGAAFLARTAALPLLAGGTLYFLWTRRPRKALAFGAGMLPVVAAWQLWVKANVSPSTDFVTLYYTNYFGYYKSVLPWDRLPELVWQNAGAFVYGIAEIVFFFEASDILWQQLARISAAMAIAGLVRLIARRRVRVFPWFAALFTATMLIWISPPLGRYSLPLLPWLVAGAYTEARHLAGIVAATWRRNRSGDRVVAAMVAGAVASMLAFAAVRMHFGFTGYVDGVFAHCSRSRPQYAAAYRWIGQNVPAEARVFAYADPMLYLHTGRRGASLRTPPAMYYQSDRREIDYLFDTLPGFAREYGLGYVMFTAGDFQVDHSEAGFRTLRERFAGLPGFETVHETGDTVIYRVHPGLSAKAPTTVNR